MEEFTKKYLICSYKTDDDIDLNSDELEIKNNKIATLLEEGTEIELKKMLNKTLKISKTLVAIRFYERNYIVKEGLKYESDPYDISPWIYFGQRINSSNKYSYCKVNNDVYVMNNDDLTYNEYINLKKQAQKQKKLTI